MSVGKVRKSHVVSAQKRIVGRPSRLDTAWPQYGHCIIHQVTVDGWSTTKRVWVRPSMGQCNANARYGLGAMLSVYPP